MTATSTPTLEMLPNMRDVAATIAKDARESWAGVDVVSIGPVFAELGSGGMQYSVVVIVPERGRKDFAPSHIILDIAQDPFMATVYRTAFVVALEEFLAAFKCSAAS